MTTATRWTIFSLALGVAGGFGVLRSKDQSTDTPFFVQAKSDSFKRAADLTTVGKSADEGLQPRKPASLKNPSSSTQDVKEQEPTMMAGFVFGGGGKSETSDILVSREELEWRALKVEQEANKKLKNLLQVLDLPDDTQNRIFVALAKHSDYYHPALGFQNPNGGTITPQKPEPTKPNVPDPAQPEVKPAPESPDPTTPEQPVPEIPVEEPEDPVIDELTPEEREAYERAVAEREEFWSGVIEEVEAQLNQ